MFRSKTLFVIGAGASKDLGLPLGLDLTGQIVDLLRIQKIGGYWSLVNSTMDAAVRDLSQRTGTGVDEFYAASSIMARAMPIAASIDNYIEAQQGDVVIEALGKLAIALRIRQAERESQLFFDGRQGNRPPLTDLSRHWQASLCRYLFEGVHRRDAASVFDKVVFVVFNYDRCLEMFLFCALMDYYNLNEAEAADILKLATFIHPYGSVGGLAFNSPHNGYGFGAELGAEELVDLSQTIVTYSESIHSSRASEISQAVGDARNAVFLGFSFLQQNMGLLENLTQMDRVYATAVGFSDSDVARAKERIVDAFNLHHGDSVDVRNTLDAKGLMSEYSLSITQ